MSRFTRSLKTVAASESQKNSASLETWNSVRQFESEPFLGKCQREYLPSQSLLKHFFFRSGPPFHKSRSVGSLALGSLAPTARWSCSSVSASSAPPRRRTCACEASLSITFFCADGSRSLSRKKNLVDSSGGAFRGRRAPLPRPAPPRCRSLGG